MRPIYTLIYIAIAALSSCTSQNTTTAQSAKTADATKQTVNFDADSAYAYIAQQVSFGPRVPNSEAHRQCGDWLVSKLNDLGATKVVEQTAVLTAYDGTSLNARNISASVNPDANKRILLLAHWDSRPWADQETDPALRNKPIDGANDGASGVGVILEIVRNVAKTQPKIGVDVLLVDAEDMGRRADQDDGADSDSWCLGSQYWAANPTLDLNKIRYAILLDMVGGKDAVFPREYFSQRYASDINNKVWNTAKSSGYGARFVDEEGTPVIDDHLPLIKAGVKAIDIIETANPKTDSFNPTWHTLADNMDNIDRETLKIVGQTLQNLIYNE